jgi:hypothetical protein
MRINFCSLIFLLLMVLTSCGYFSTGKWEDDNKNWARAYKQPLPDTIDLLHSWYWRSPHWSLEQAMYFEIKYNAGVKENFIKYPDMIRLDEKDTINLEFFNEKPKWFTYKPLRKYTIWKSNLTNFLLFLDKENGHLYWTDYQL